MFLGTCVQIIAFSKQNYKNILAILHQAHNFQFFTNTKEIHYVASKWNLFLDKQEKNFCTHDNFEISWVFFSHLCVKIFRSLHCNFDFF